MALNFWICDSCKNKITDIHNALVVWSYADSDDSRAAKFMIVHKNVDGYICDPGESSGSWELDQVLGVDGLTTLLAMISPGPLQAQMSFYPLVEDLDEFVDLIRRLQTPWYEEARANFSDPEVQAQMEGANEVLPYLQSTLRRIALRGASH